MRSTSQRREPTPILAQSGRPHRRWLAGWAILLALLSESLNAPAQETSPVPAAAPSTLPPAATPSSNPLNVGPPASPVPASPAPASQVTDPSDEEPPPPPLFGGSPDDPAVEQRARWHTAEARRAFDRRAYDVALAELRSAYDIQPRAILLFNIGQSLRRLGRHPEAIEYYRRFVEQDPQNRHASEARTILADLTQIQRQQAALVQADKERRRPIWKRAWFWGGLGSGVALIITGVALGVALAPKEPDTELGVVDIRVR